MSESDYITGTGIKREGAKWGVDELLEVDNG